VCHCAVKNIIGETEVLVSGGQTVGGKEERRGEGGRELERDRKKQRDACMCFQ